MTKIWVAANGSHKKSCGTAAGLRRRLVPLALCLAIATPATAAPDGTADIIFVRGNVIPMTAPDARAQALAVKDGRIEAIGTDAEIDGYKGKDTKVVDLAGRTLLPGFIDAHGHLTLLAQRSAMAELAPPPVGPVSDIAGLQAAMRDFAKAHPDGWLVGSGYDDARMTEGRHPTRQELDAVSADRPVVAVHVSSHLAALNTKALEMTGLLHAAENPPGGVVRREADGRTASGVIEEGALFKALANLPRPAIDRQIAQLTAAQHVYARNGLTTAQDGAASADAWDLLKEAARRSALFLDVNALPLIAFPFPDLDKVPFNAPYDRHLRAAGVKIIVDGSPQGRTAWLSEPYHQAPAGLPADYAGYRQIPDDRLKAMLRRAAGNGWRVFAHVNGDAAIQQLIDTVRAVGREGGAKPKRTIAIHTQTARRDQLQAMKELDIEPTFFAAHSFYWGDWHREVTLGPVRADHISPQRAAFDLGLRPTIHNDSPIVPPDMIRLIWSAATRRTRSDDILGPGERVTPYEALQEITSNASYQLQEEHLKGTLEPGKLADLVILDADPLSTPPERLLDLRVVATIKEGRYIFGE